MKREKKNVVLVYLSIAVITLLILVPWISLYWDRYLQKIYAIFNNIGYAHGTTTSTEIAGNILATLLSHEELAYGNTFRDYMGIVIMLCLAALATGWITWKNKPRTELFPQIPFLAVFLGTIISFGLQFNFGPARLVVRYSCPLLIGASPAAVLMGGWFWAQAKNPKQIDPSYKKIALFIGVILFLSQLGLLSIFTGTFITRVQKTYLHRTLFSSYLAEDAKYKLYNDYVLSEQARERMLQIQGMVPAGETILAWSAMPLHFDFRRNHIYTINSSGMAYNLLIMPLDDGAEQMRDYFNRFGIRYIIWDYSSYGMRNPSQLGSLQNKFRDILNRLISINNVVYKDKMSVVFDIGHGT